MPTQEPMNWDIEKKFLRESLHAAGFYTEEARAALAYNRLDRAQQHLRIVQDSLADLRACLKNLGLL